MTLCFGELEESASRAFWEEEDEFEDDLQDVGCPDRSCQVEWLMDKNCIPHNFDVFIIVDGPFVKGVFEQAVVSNKELVAKIKDLQNPTGRHKDNADKSNVVGQVFLFDNKALVCICEANLDITNTFYFTSELFPLMMSSKEIMVLTSSSVTSYFHHDKKELPISFLRSLQTVNYTGEPFCERLEQPNIVSGISAQVLSWCQAHNLSAVLYICYLECDELDSVTTKPIAQLLSKLNIPKLRVNIANLHSSPVVKSSTLLYM